MNSVQTSPTLKMTSQTTADLDVQKPGYLPEPGIPAEKISDRSGVVVTSQSHQNSKLDQPQGKIGTQKKLADEVSQSYISYRARWYLLAVFSCLSMLQCTVWNQFGPIYESMQKVFNWSDTQVALMPFYGTLCFSLFVMPAVWVTERHGMRPVVVTMALLVLVGLVIRCISVDNIKLQNWLINVSGILNGIAGATTVYVPTALSAKWFPAKERKLATSIGIVLNQAGVMVSFLIGPLVVPVPRDLSSSEREHSLHRYFYLTYAEAVLSLLLTVCTLAYFPSNPKTPVSPSAEAERITNLKSMRDAIRNPRFWFLALPAVLSLGAYLGWQPVLGLSLEQNNVSQSHAGWMGCWSVLGGLILAVLAGKLADTFPQQLKAVTLTSAILAFEGMILLFILNQGYISFNLKTMYFAVILSGTSTGAFFPLALEMAAETCYPLDETTVSGFIGCGINLVITVFLGVIFRPNISLNWMTWFLLVAWVVSLPVMVFWPTNYHRSNLDGVTQDLEEQQQRTD